MPSALNDLRNWIKRRETPTSDFLFRSAKAVTGFEIPAWKPLFGSLYLTHVQVRNLLASLVRILYWTPLFKSRLATPAHKLNLYGGLPYMSGPLQFEVGDRCRISGATTFTGRTASRETPLLKLGDNVGIGWQTTIAVGSKVILGDNVRIAGRAFLAGYPGHPLDPKARADGLPDLDSQVGDIILENDVWLGTGVTVSAGVTIGAGTVVAGGSVVSKSLPAGVLAGGVPAKVLRKIEAHENPEDLH